MLLLPKPGGSQLTQNQWFDVKRSCNSNRCGSQFTQKMVLCMVSYTTVEGPQRIQKQWFCVRRSCNPNPGTPNLHKINRFVQGPQAAQSRGAPTYTKPMVLRKAPLHPRPGAHNLHKTKDFVSGAPGTQTWGFPTYTNQWFCVRRSSIPKTGVPNLQKTNGFV